MKRTTKYVALGAASQKAAGDSPSGARLWDEVRAQGGVSDTELTCCEGQATRI